MNPLSAGDKLGPYEILSSIGAGGMGEVWKARDTRLDRIVAIKRLKGEYGVRFQQEARAIAALNHPHICQIYDVGPDYLVLEYIEGKPSTGPLAPADVVRVAIQIAAALEAAHSKGILHRDLKPANILMTGAGAKLLDFGLAKLASDEDATRTIGVSGTPLYMSPEQAEGKALDVRSDVFSFGTVVYELLAGKRAFDSLGGVLRDEPARLDVAPDLARIVMRCLRKAPADRFQNFTDLKASLEQCGGKQVEQQPSIAVLPFANMSADKENEYFSDGLAEEILNLLAKVPGLKVIARTSSFAFRGKEQDIRKIGEALDVGTVLEGSVRRSGSRIRVAAQLINAKDGAHIWSERYDRELTDVFAVQDEIAAAIAQALHVTLAAKPELKPRYQPSLPSYDAFLKGRRLLFMGSPADVARAKEYLNQALLLDPNYAEAFAELGFHYYLQSQLGVRPGTEALPLAREAAQKALNLAASNARAHALLGLVAAFLDFDWKTGDEHIQRAYAAGGLEPEVRARCLLPHLARGHFADGIRELESVLVLDPVGVVPRMVLSMHLLMSDQYERALAEAKVAMELDPLVWVSRFVMGLAYAGRGMFREAREWAEEAVKVSPWSAQCTALLAGVSERLGERQRSAELITPWGKHPAMLIYHLLSSNLEGAADCFETAIAQRDPAPMLWASAGFTKPLRESSRWPSIARKMNLG